MAAGGITVTHPDTIIYTGNINRIVIVDGAGVQHEVKQVYWSPDGINANLVWPTIQKTLVAGDTAVAIQYKPTVDISVTDIGIFTAESVTGRTAKIKVFHESGLCIAAVNGDVKTTGETLYNLQFRN